ncbi:MAG: response regulator [Acidimicrobiia bacterium]|nr:response regulator [Acidimicrobiia bacterium]MDX2467054.1 response regulator [Acidimicrobiia bacterium]
MENEQTSGGPPDLLVVEDNTLHARLVLTMLREAWGDDAPVRHVKRLESALDAIVESAPDCVLLDLVLPDADGLEAVDAVLLHAAHVPIVVLSAHKDDHLALRAVRRGAQDYLVKGTVTADALARSVQLAIQRHHAENRVTPGQSTAATDLPATAPDTAEGPAAIAILDKDGAVLFAEEDAADMLGLPLAEVIGIPLVAMCHPADMDRWRASIEKEDEDLTEVIVRIIHPSGAEFRVGITLEPLSNGQNPRAAFLAMFQHHSDEGTASSGAYAVVSGWGDE